MLCIGKFIFYPQVLLLLLGGSDDVQTLNVDTGNNEAGTDSNFYSAAYHVESSSTYEDGGQCALDGVHLREFGISNGIFIVDDTWMGPHQGDAPSMVSVSAEVDEVGLL